MKNLALLFISLGLGLAGAEFGLRLLLDEKDYLLPVLIDDPVLGHAIAPGSGGHDAWGFRNEEVPETVEVVAIGDSQTYGISASASETWPAWLTHLSGVSSYNLALGGYGPLEYVQLLTTKAFRLRPRTVLVGVYLGNDLYDAWATANHERRVVPQRDSLGLLRDFLSQHSLLYQATKASLTSLTQLIRYKEAVSEPGNIGFAHPLLRTVFTTEQRRSVIDQSRPQNVEGLKISLAALTHMHRQCCLNWLNCWIVLIPTKESVYWPFAKDIIPGKGQRQLAGLVAAEQRVRAIFIDAFERNGIDFIDVLPSMREAAARHALYPVGDDGHPTSDGYRVIAETVLKAIGAEMFLGRSHDMTCHGARDRPVLRCPFANRDERLRYEQKPFTVNDGVREQASHHPISQEIRPLDGRDGVIQASCSPVPAKIER